MYSDVNYEIFIKYISPLFYKLLITLSYKKVDHLGTCLILTIFKELLIQFVKIFSSFAKMNLQE